MSGKNKAAVLVAEFLGTYALASVVFTMVSRTASPFFPAFAAATTLAVMVLTIGSTSGAHINPAVTFGLWSIKKFPTTSAIAYIAVQMLAGLVALRVNQRLLGDVLAGFAYPAWNWSVLFGEFTGTFIFTFGIAAAVYKGFTGSQQAVTIGGALLVGIFVASNGSAGVLNPAVALAVNSFSASYVIAPLVGAVLGMSLYKYVFADVEAPEKPAKSAATKTTRRANTKAKPASRKKR